MQLFISYLFQNNQTKHLFYRFAFVEKVLKVKNKIEETTIRLSVIIIIIIIIISLLSFKMVEQVDFSFAILVCIFIDS